MPSDPRSGQVTTALEFTFPTSLGGWVREEGLELYLQCFFLYSLIGFLRILVYNSILVSASCIFQQRFTCLNGFLCHYVLVSIVLLKCFWIFIVVSGLRIQTRRRSLGVVHFFGLRRCFLKLRAGLLHRWQRITRKFQKVYSKEVSKFRGLTEIVT